MLFRNRIDAAQQILPLLEQYRGKDAVILAVPRGGVPIGSYLARELRLPLDLLWVKKLGHPLNGEVAIGAVSLEGHVVDMDYNVDPKYVAREIGRIHELLQERRRELTGGRAPQTLAGKVVIIVDDGVATGKTLVAATRMLRKQNPAKIVIAVPVSAPSGKEEIGALADEFITVAEPLDFMGVGMYYRDFTQVSDDEVRKLLNMQETS